MNAANDKVRPKNVWALPKQATNHSTLAGERFAWLMSGYQSGIHPDDLDRALAIARRLPGMSKLTAEDMVNRYYEILRLLAPYEDTVHEPELSGEANTPMVADVVAQASK